jgi:hypothetical protein
VGHLTDLSLEYYWRREKKVRSPWGRVPISSQRMCTLRRASSTDGIGGSIIRQMSASRPNGCLTKADGLVVPA